MSKDERKIGDRMPDGSIYAGSLDGVALYAFHEEQAEGRSVNQISKDFAARGLRMATVKELPIVMKALNIASRGVENHDPGWCWSGDKGPEQQKLAIPVKAVRPEPGGMG